MNDCWLSASERPSFKKICESLDNAIIDTVFQDKDARDFWRKWFPGKDSVPYDEFEIALVKFLAMETFEEALRESFKDLLGFSPKKPETQYVSREKFSQILTWFGPMISKTPNSEPNFLEKYQMDFLCLKGFHPTATRESASQLLEGKKVGTYLFRFGSTVGDFVLVRVGAKSTVPYRLTYTYDPNSNNQGIYTFEDKSTYASLSGFLDRLRELKLTIGEPVLFHAKYTSGYEKSLLEQETKTSEL